MCSGRVDLEFIFRAFAKKADGVFIGGCHLNDCHYNPEGNYDALGNSLVAKRILENVGVNPERLRLEWVSAGEGIRFAEVMNEFVGQDQEPWARSGSSEGKRCRRTAGRAAGGHRPGALHQAGRARAVPGAGEDRRGLPQVLRQRPSSTSCSRS